MLNLKNTKILAKTTLTLVKTQQLPDIENVDSENEIICLKRTIYNGRRKICINVQTDTDKVNVVVNRFQNNAFIKDTELELNLLEFKKLLAKRVYLLSFIVIFYNRCIVLDETTVQN